MNVLLVDDDYYVIQGLQTGIDWKGMGIGRVYTARNVREAKAFFEQDVIDLLLCDIEMPHGSGLELLKWIREQEYQTVNIFLTSYAQFEYAKQALELGSFDYYLKPISYEKLTGILHRACQKSAEMKRQTLYFQFGERWVREEQQRKNTFFRRLITEDFPKGTNVWETVLREGIGFLPENSFRILMLELVLKQEESSLEKSLLSYALQNIAAEFFVSPEKALSIGGIYRNQDQWYLLLAEDKKEHRNDLKSAAECLIKECNRYITDEMKCFLSEPIALENVFQTVKMLVQISRKHVYAENGVFVQWEDSSINLAGNYQKPDLAAWEQLLKTEKKQELLRQIDDYLDRVAKNGAMDYSALHQFYYDLLQVIFSVLGKKQIQAHLLFSEYESGDLYRQALHSLRGMKMTVHHLILSAMEYCRYSKEPRSIADRICDYIDERFSENITRETIGKELFMHPNYIARIFKKEKGKSIGSYLTDRRIAVAMSLLSDGQVPVNYVAQQIGYDNFSYFAKVFKEKTGLSPHEYQRERAPSNRRANS